MKDSRWIWLDAPTEVDSYVEFKQTFAAVPGEKVLLKYAADSNCAVYVNDELVCYGYCGDFPDYKLYRKKDITHSCRAENEIRFVVWYYGFEHQIYIKDQAGLIFEVSQKGKVLAASGTHTLSRKDIRYRHGYEKWMTPQLGHSFYFDNRVVNDLPFLPSVECEKQPAVHLRQTPNMPLLKPHPYTIAKNEEGYLIDMHEEVAGYLELDLECGSEQELLISYGEHLVKDDKVPRILGARDFSVEFYAKEGRNQYLNPFRRLAGRYLQLVCGPDVKVNSLTLRPANLPFRKIKHQFADPLQQKIYDISVNTLILCAHEHYEDCPWREQALYTMDSRNQMLCGYYAFEGHTYQRDNLIYISKGLGKFGMLDICFPCGVDIPIPFFSFVYFMQIAEYIKHTGDKSILKHAEKPLRTIMKTFTEKIDETGLIPRFAMPFWNFYEWTEYSDGRQDYGKEYLAQHDLILNCMYVYACGLYEEIFGEHLDVSAMKQRIKEAFYVEDKGLFRLSTNGQQFSQLGNSMAILADVAGEELIDKIINDKSLIPITLSMNTFFYEAMKKYGHKYDSFILDDIKRKYLPMIEAGATTFWETEKGVCDFDSAGSLCHGWSAMPVYYMLTLQEN